MTSLPQPIGRCVAPTTFTPSRLAAGERCLLRTLLESAPKTPALRAHPLADLGSVLHALLERCVKGQVERRDSPGADAARTLEELLDEADARLVERYEIEAPRLRELLPYMTWRRKRRVVLDLAERHLTSAKASRGAAFGGGKQSAAVLPSRGVWAEVDFDLPALRLRGRADLVERDAGLVTIRDLKTGRVLDAEGEVLPHIELQLRLYGLMAESVWPSCRVRLAVDFGEEREIAFDEAVRSETQAWLDTTMHRVPAGREFAADALATPGAGCVGCPFRHVCGAYMTWAPAMWRKGSPIEMPLDTWGAVVDSATAGPASTHLTLRDDAGRLVKVFHARSRDLKNAHVGDRVWLFNLRSRDRHVGTGLRQHPLNFYEADPNDATDRAWALQVFHMTD
jgi:RecB family exonuclease